MWGIIIGGSAVALLIGFVYHKTRKKSKAEQKAWNEYKEKSANCSHNYYKKGGKKK